MRHHLSIIPIAAIAVCGISTVIPAKADDTTPMTATSAKTEYNLKQKNTPIDIEPYNTTLYGISLNTLLNPGGNILYSTKNELSGLKVNPTGVSAAFIETDKKGRKNVYIYDLQTVENKIWELNRKKYGEPTAIAYTADGKKLAIATDSGLYIFDPREMTLIDTMELPFSPDAMTFSDNNYFLAFRSGDRVAIYNFEEKKPRRDWTFGVPVNDMKFNKDASEFAVLTSDGALTIYDTRRFNIKNDVEDLNHALACSFNTNGKYIAVATDSTSIELINLVRPSDRNTLPVEKGMVCDVAFITDFKDNPIVAFTTDMAIGAKKLLNLEPHYAQLIKDQADLMMEEWLKMMPGESMEAYRQRVNEETRTSQRRLYEGMISTQLAGDLLSGQTITLGNYDRTNQVLALAFSEMPTIFLPVPESDISSFRDAGDLLLSDVQYGVLGDDTFEIIYAKVFNKTDGKTYEYNNINRANMDFMKSDDNVVSLEILQQQQMEELRLQELREKIVAEAQHNNLISNHTNITVDSRVVPDYNADGDKILNYEVSVTYQVDPEFSAAEDFPPGKYLIDESGAASSMLKIVKEAFDGDFAQYIKSGKKLKITISGTADGTPIIRTIPYNGVYGDFKDEPVFENGELTAITVTEKEGIKENRQLAFLRAEGVKDYLEKNVENLSKMNNDYTFRIDVTEGKGSEFRRINATFVFADAF